LTDGLDKKSTKTIEKIPKCKLQKFLKNFQNEKMKALLEEKFQVAC